MVTSNTFLNVAPWHHAVEHLEEMRTVNGPAGRQPMGLWPLPWRFHDEMLMGFAHTSFRINMFETWFSYHYSHPDPDRGR